MLQRTEPLSPPVWPSLTLELKQALARPGAGDPADRAANALLEALQARLAFSAGAVYWIMGRQTALGATHIEAAMAAAPTVQFWAEIPFLRALGEGDQGYLAATVASLPDWRDHPLLPGVESVLAMPVGDLESWGAIIVLGWSSPAGALTTDIAPAVEGAGWLGNWLATTAGTARRSTRTIMQSPVHEPPAEGVESAWTLQREASGILHRAMRATGRSRGILLGLEGGEPTLLATSRLDWARIRRSSALAAAVHEAVNSSELREPVYLPPQEPSGEGLMLVPLAHAGQPAHGLILLGGGRRGSYSLHDFFACEEVSQAASYHVKALQQAWYTNGERTTHQHLESLTQELGNKLSFNEMFQVVARWLPRLMPASWLGMCRFPSGEAGDLTEGLASVSHEVWINRTGGVQPPLIPRVTPLLRNIDLSLPLTYITQELSGGALEHPIVVIPVHLGNRTIAALLVASATAAGFTERQLATLRELSASIALAFRYVQLFEMVERAKRDWEHSFDAITDTLAVITPTRRIRRVNKTFALERGLTPAELVGQPCHAALYGLAEPCPGCPLDRAIALKMPTEVEVLSEANDRLYLSSLFPVQNEAGEVADVVEFAKDVTLSRDLQQKLLQTERLRALGEMAGGVAHDFNNTLAGVLGQVELLLQRTHEPNMERGLRVIAQAATDGAATVRRIQNFSRTSRGEEVAPTDLNQMVLDALEVCSPRWKDQSDRDGISIYVRQDLRATSPVAGVASELREVLVNVLLNGLEAMPAGGTLTLRTGENSRWVWVSVADQGVGMTDEVRQHIYDPFYTTKGIANSGLGMSVVYGIIKLHRGDVSVASEEGKGTSVTIRLPKASSLPLVTPAPIPAEVSAAPATWRVLVADDDVRLADMLRQMLELDGHTVTLCHGGAAAIEALASARFDIVLTDLGMPDVSGWEVIAAARQINPSMCTGLVTGWGVQLEDQELSGKGVDVVMPKPYTMNALRASVAQLADLRQQRVGTPV